MQRNKHPHTSPAPTSQKSLGIAAKDVFPMIAMQKVVFVLTICLVIFTYVVNGQTASVSITSATASSTSNLLSTFSVSVLVQLSDTTLLDTPLTVNVRVLDPSDSNFVLATASGVYTLDTTSQAFTLVFSSQNSLPFGEMDYVAALANSDSPLLASSATYKVTPTKFNNLYGTGGQLDAAFDAGSSIQIVSSQVQILNINGAAQYQYNIVVQFVNNHGVGASVFLEMFDMDTGSLIGTTSGDIGSIQHGTLTLDVTILFPTKNIRYEAYLVDQDLLDADADAAMEDMFSFAKQEVPGGVLNLATVPGTQSIGTNNAFIVLINSAKTSDPTVVEYTVITMFTAVNGEDNTAIILLGDGSSDKIIAQEVVQVTSTIGPIRSTFEVNQFISEPVVQASITTSADYNATGGDNPFAYSSSTVLQDVAQPQGPSTDAPTQAPVRPTSAPTQSNPKTTAAPTETPAGAETVTIHRSLSSSQAIAIGLGVIVGIGAVVGGVFCLRRKISKPDDGGLPLVTNVSTNVVGSQYMKQSALERIQEGNN
jgi:hypothetical protein